MAKKSKRAYTAVGAYIFAGGFTRGIRDAGFDVKCVLEANDYGVATMRKNQPEVPVHVGVPNWAPALESLFPAEPGVHRPIDFIYGNPPCAAWSVAGVGKAGSERGWRKDPRVECTRNHFELLERWRPRFWAWESVTEAFTKGREFVDELTRRALALGYNVTYVLHNAAYLGVPQRRHRFFFVAHNLAFEPEVTDWSTTTVGQALRMINDPGEPYRQIVTEQERYGWLLPHTAQGDNLRDTFNRLRPDAPKNARGHVTGRPSFLRYRLKENEVAHTIMCDVVHPTEHRFITLREIAHLCGYPYGYDLAEPTSMNEYSRGVSPKVGEWLGRQVARALDSNRPVNAGQSGHRVRLYDFREPPGSFELLPEPAPVAVTTAVSPVGSAASASSAVTEAACGIASAVLPQLTGVGADVIIPDEVYALEAEGATREQALAILGLVPKPTAVFPTPSGPAPGAAADNVPPPAAVRAPEPATGAWRGSGELIKHYLLAGRSTEEILRLNKEEFPSSKATAADVSYHRGKLKKAGQLVTTNPAVLAAQAAVRSPENLQPPVTINAGTIAHPPSVTQPLRTSAAPAHVDQAREFDTSSLKEKQHGGYVHRDYAAHFFRWGFVARFIKQDETTVLDVGCGTDVPLARLLNHPRYSVPKSYLGVDLNPAPAELPKRHWATFRFNTNFLETREALGEFDLVTCLEVIEHMRRDDGVELLDRLAAHLAPTGTLLLSTPVFNGKAAANHLHEWGAQELAEALTEAGLDVVGRYGTFASPKVLKQHLAAQTQGTEINIRTREHLATLKALEQFYSPEVAACFLAPMYPDQSRNNVWVLKRRP